MQCASCGFAWDVNDPDPPTCGAELTQRALCVADTLSRIASDVRMWVADEKIPRESVVDALEVGLQTCKEAMGR
jgi:hypothetical protein